MEKISIKTPNPYLHFLIDPSFQGERKVSVLSIENTADRTVQKKYYLPTSEVNNYNVMINRQNALDQQVKNDLRTYDNIRKIAIDQGDR